MKKASKAEFHVHAVALGSGLLVQTSHEGEKEQRRKHKKQCYPITVCFPHLMFGKFHYTQCYRDPNPPQYRTPQCHRAETDVQGFETKSVEGYKQHTSTYSVHTHINVYTMCIRIYIYMLHAYISYTRSV